MPNPNTRYASYLFRFWQVQNGKRATWVVSIQSTTTGEQRRFPSVDALLEFLRAEFGGCQPAGDAVPQGRVETIQELE